MSEPTAVVAAGAELRRERANGQEGGSGIDREDAVDGLVIERVVQERLEDGFRRGPA